ncbi:MAG: type I-F CRISPR-associated endoribonuclease Cas6/Csy4 [Gammaproteobacteria bacterium]|nr:MAG: type I-F CRISPR-associated endoribonuclease Cas6/Csy4 [Gammaproteobacteria bacterium]
MQTHYLDLKAIPQEDLTPSQVMSDMMQILHRHLPAYNNSEREEDHIAVSFPAYRQRVTLGGIIRLHGGKEHLFDLHDSLTPLTGYALVGAVMEVPVKIKGYATFSRKQYKGAAAARRMKARYTSRKDKTWTNELANAIVKKYSSHVPVPAR